MFKQTLYCAVLAVFVHAGSFGASGAAEFGTAEEAKAMLGRAIAEVRANKSGAIEKFNHNVWPFRDRDLFVFCFNADDGKFTAHDAFVSQDARILRDSEGRSFGEEMYRKAKEAEIVEVRFVSPFPGSARQVPKRAYVTRIGDQVCGVSAYLYNGPGE